MPPVCLPCNKEMRCTKNEILIRVGRGYFRSADEYTCPACGQRVASGIAPLAHRLEGNVKFDADLSQEMW